MVDFHSHILPAVDDGSRNIEESLKLLIMLSEQGIDTVVATPHFYADRVSVSDFVLNRDNAFEALKQKLTPEHPKIVLGAEVKFYPGISRLEGIEKLCVSGTNKLLLEMPFGKWSAMTIKETIELANIKNLSVVIAHIDRYLSYQGLNTLDELLDNGILIQANADFFLHRLTRRKALKMLDNGEIHFLGSDCHNVVTRPPEIGAAISVIKKKYGKDYIVLMSDFAKKQLNQI